MGSCNQQLNLYAITRAKGNVTRSGEHHWIFLGENTVLLFSPSIFCRHNSANSFVAKQVILHSCQSTIASRFPKSMESPETNLFRFAGQRPQRGSYISGCLVLHFFGKNLKSWSSAEKKNRGLTTTRTQKSGRNACEGVAPFRVSDEIHFSSH